jgi:hypothetical protein
LTVREADIRATKRERAGGVEEKFGTDRRAASG